jgi:hypothetical protein
MFRPAKIAVALAALGIGLTGLASAQLAGSASALEPSAGANCAAQVWPQIDPTCLAPAAGAPPRVVRVIEPGDTAAQPVLVRLPAAE